MVNVRDGGREIDLGKVDIYIYVYLILIYFHLPLFLRIHFIRNILYIYIV